MKKIILLTLLALLCFSLFAVPTAKSLFFADSYMLRANGVEALYWNPAKLAIHQHIDLWLPALNSGIQISNNSLDLDTYNYFVTQDTLSTQDKELILNKIDGSISVDGSASVSVFGITLGNTAISSSAHMYGKGELSKDFLLLAFYGNTEEEYVFTKANNNASLISYVDLTYGAGDFKIPFIPENYPQIKAGFAASLLAGVQSIDTQEFDLHFSSTMEEGANLHSEVLLRSGVGGMGFKGLLGMYSEITPWLEAGITVDNVLGAINWNIANEVRRFSASADSVYISNIEEDIVQTSNEKEKIGSFTTKLGTEMRLAALYKHPIVTVSADWVQGFSESTVSSKVGRLSLGAGFLPVPYLPVSVGISLPNSRHPVKVSYGVGIKSKGNEFNLALQSFDSLVPGYKSKGFSFGVATRIWF
jgi:hypothetical protein